MSSSPLDSPLEIVFDSRPKRTCIRSIFPLELMEEIFAYLDKQTFVALCMVSVGCLQEAVRDLYRDVVLKSDVALLHFFTSPSLPRNSRLREILSTSHIRTLALNVTQATQGSGPKQEQTLFHYLGRHGTSFLPLRLAASTTVRLDSLTITAPFFNGLSSAYWLSFLPHFNPVHVNFWSESTEELSRAEKPIFTGIRRTLFLLQWTRLRSCSFVGWLPIDPLIPNKLPSSSSSSSSTIDFSYPATASLNVPALPPALPLLAPANHHTLPPPKPSTTPFFLHDSPHLPDREGELVLHVDSRLLHSGHETLVLQAGVWTQERVSARESIARSMLELKGLGVGGFKVSVSAAEEGATVKRWMEVKLTEEQREKIEVVVRNVKEEGGEEEREEEEGEPNDL